MYKTHLQVVGIAVVSIVLLSLLPKYVVTGSKQLQDEAPTTEAAQNDEMHGVSGITAEKQFQLDSMLSLFKKQPNFDLALQIAASFKEFNRFDSAAYYFQQLADATQNEEALLAAGELYYEAFTFAVNTERSAVLGKLARESLQKYLDKYPGYLDAKTKIGMTYVVTSNPMQGILMIREVLQEDPKNKLALFNLGVLAMQSGQWDKALARFQTLSEVDPNDPQNKFYLGICFKEMGNKSEAKKYFQEVLAIENDPQIINTVNSYLEELK